MLTKDSFTETFQREDIFQEAKEVLLHW